MPFLIESLIATYPYVDHLTAQRNLARIRATGQLESAATLMQRANRLDLLSVKRTGLTEIDVDGNTVILRDQSPLHAGHIRFEGGWDFAQFIESLNRQVFFWPGKASGPIAYGERHFGRYSDERPPIVRIPLSDLLAANPGRVPLFCGYNSGSPRTTGGRKSPRGPNTFLPCEQFLHNHRKAIEVCFDESVVLPMEASEIKLASATKWRGLLTVDL